MATNREEIIADFQEHIRKVGGASGDWLIGTAKDTHRPFFRNHIVADLGDGLIYREAFTSNAAQAICEHFTNECGLGPDEAERGSALQATGKIVFIYRKIASAQGPPPADQPVFSKLAA